MRKLNNLKWFSIGVAVCLIVSIIATPAFASSLTKSAQLIYNNIKISLNGTTITPKDASGNVVEPFTINGTTYLPVRAISNALGLGINWNSSTNTVEINSNPNGASTSSSTTETNYQNTEIPTYTSITGRALKQAKEGAYIYDYDAGECVDYQYYLVQHGYTKSENIVEDNSVTVYFYNGSCFVALRYAVQYNEVWIVVR